MEMIERINKGRVGPAVVVSDVQPETGPAEPPVQPAPAGATMFGGVLSRSSIPQAELDAFYAKKKAQRTRGGSWVLLLPAGDWSQGPMWVSAQKRFDWEMELLSMISYDELLEFLFEMMRKRHINWEEAQRIITQMNDRRQEIGLPILPPMNPATVQNEKQEILGFKGATEFGGVLSAKDIPPEELAAWRRSQKKGGK